MEKINVRLSPALHRDLSLASQVTGMSLGKLAAGLLAKHLPDYMDSDEFQRALRDHSSAIDRLRRAAFPGETLNDGLPAVAD